MSLIYDPFIETNRCVQRLLDIHRDGKRLIVAVDFDDTLFGYASSSHTHPLALDIVRRAQKIGCYICLFTASHPDRFKMMLDYLKLQLIKVDSINQNPIKELEYGYNGKMFYNILLDDRAGLGQAIEILTKVVETIEKEKKI
jgi:hypothetical protein